MAIKKIDNFNIHENPSTNEENFDIENYLNVNFRKTKEAINNNADELIQLKAECERLKKDREATSIVEEATGEVLSLVDSSSARFNEFEICGNCEQETREGYNLLGVIDGTYSASSNSITFKNGIGTLNIVNSSSNFGIEVQLHPQTLKAGKTYTVTNNTKDKYPYVQIRDIDGNITDDMTYGDNGIKTFSLNEDKTITRAFLYFDVSKGNIKISPMLLEGSYTNNTLPNYEQYGAMPSINYPSEIKAVGQDVNIFDKDNANILNAFIRYGDKVIVPTTNGRTLYLPCKPNRNYTIQKIKTLVFRAGSSSTEPEMNDVIENPMIGDSKTEMNYTTNSNAKYLVINFRINEDTIDEQEILDSIKIVEGTQINGYSPYGQGSTSFTVCNRNLVKKFNNYSIYCNSTGTQKEITEEYIKVTPNATSAYSGIFIEGLVDENLIKKVGNNKVSFSFRAKSDSARTIKIKIFNNSREINLASNWQTFKIENVNLSSIGTQEFYSGSSLSTVSYYIKDIQLEEGTTSSNYIPHEEQIHTIPVQKEFCKIGDYKDRFVKKDGKWYEKHNFGYVNTLNNTSITVTKSNTSTDDFFRYIVGLGATDRKTGSSLKIYCTHMKYASSRWNVVEGICGWETGTSFCISTFNKELDTAEKLKTFLQENNVEIYYELSEPELIECTEQQTAILDEIETELHSYEGGTHVFSTDEISPNFNVKYSADLKACIANQINNLSSAMLEIGGN